MERQTIVIQYVGEQADHNVESAAVVAFLNTLAKGGVYVDATIDPIAHHFTETDVAKVVAMIADKSKATGVTIKVENPMRKAGLSKKDRDKILSVFEEILNG